MKMKTIQFFYILRGTKNILTPFVLKFVWIEFISLKVKSQK